MLQVFVKERKRDRLDIEHSECKGDQGYLLSVCLDKFIARQVGCNWPWTISNKVCDDNLPNSETIPG